MNACNEMHFNATVNVNIAFIFVCFILKGLQQLRNLRGSARRQHHHRRGKSRTNWRDRQGHLQVEFQCK